MVLIIFWQGLIVAGENPACWRALSEKIRRVGDKDPCMVAGGFSSLSGIRISSSQLISIYTSFCFDSVPFGFWGSPSGSRFQVPVHCVPRPFQCPFSRSSLVQDWFILFLSWFSVFFDWFICFIFGSEHIQTGSVVFFPV